MSNNILTQVAEASARYIAQLPSRSVAPDKDAVDRLQSLKQPMPLEGVPASELLQDIENILAPATVASIGPRYFGFVTGGRHEASLIASWSAATWDQNVFAYNGSPAGTVVESVALDWLRQLFGFPDDTAGAFVTGATMAGFTCLAAARHALLKREGWNVEEQGLNGAPKITVVMSDEQHPTIVKALKFLGFGTSEIVRLPTDSQGRVLPDKWPDDLSGPVLLCLQAGNVNTGAFDPFDKVIPLARRCNAWVHVDGAFGLWAAVAPDRQHLTAGFTEADSWSVDGHKWLNVTYDSGLAFVRDSGALRNAVGFEAPYLPMTDERQPFHFTPESSRRMRGIEVWAVLKSIGSKGLAEHIEANCRQAKLFAERLEQAGYEILNDVELNQVLVSFGSDEVNDAVIKAVQEEGTCWSGPTVWHGRSAMRISVSCWETTEEDIERSADAVCRVANSVTVKVK